MSECSQIYVGFINSWTGGLHIWLEQGSCCNDSWNNFSNICIRAGCAVVSPCLLCLLHDFALITASKISTAKIFCLNRCVCPSKLDPLVCICRWQNFDERRLLLRSRGDRNPGLASATLWRLALSSGRQPSHCSFLFKFPPCTLNILRFIPTFMNFMRVSAI